MTLRLSRRAAIAAGAATLAMPALPRAQPAAIKLGLIHPVTGPLAFSGSQCRLGGQMAIADINAAGGIKSIGGAKIEALLGDAQLKPGAGREPGGPVRRGRRGRLHRLLLLLARAGRDSGGGEIRAALQHRLRRGRQPHHPRAEQYVPPVSARYGLRGGRGGGARRREQGGRIASEIGGPGAREQRIRHQHRQPCCRRSCRGSASR